MPNIMFRPSDMQCISVGYVGVKLQINGYDLIGRYLLLYAKNREKSEIRKNQKYKFLLNLFSNFRISFFFEE